MPEIISALGLEHLFDLTAEEKVLAFFTPAILFALFFAAQCLLISRRVPGYVINPDTGQPRNYRLNGLLVFAIAIVLWATEATGMPRDWFYRASIWSVFGGTTFAALFTLYFVFREPIGESKNPIIAFYLGRAKEVQLFNGHIDIKMWFYVVGGAMLALNALSGAVWHAENHSGNVNLGVYLYAAIYTFYITDYFIWERVQLYTYDLIHENMGFKLFWGGLIVYGWMFILPLWGMAAHPAPEMSAAASYALIAGSGALFLIGWSSPAAQTPRSTCSNASPSGASSGSSRSTSRRAIARFSAAASGVRRGTSTTLARACSVWPSPCCSATSTIPGPGPTWRSS